MIEIGLSSSILSWGLSFVAFIPLFSFLFQNLALAAGGCRSNLRKQIQIAHLFGVPVVVAVNVFKWDTRQILQTHKNHNQI